MNIVITGSSKGIGLAIAQEFAVQGNSLFLCARDKDKLVEAAAGLKDNFFADAVHSYPVDLSRKEEVTKFADWCSGYGSIDIIVNNAGRYIPGNLADEPEGRLEEMMNTNLYSAYYLTRLLLPEMVKRGTGHIFNICSIASKGAYSGGASYSITKFALDGFTMNLRHELKSTGIKVTAVYPGAVMTESWAGFDNSIKRIMEVTDVGKMVFAATQLSPQAVVEEIVLRPQLGDL